MKKLTMLAPNIKDVLEATVNNYPQGYDWDYEVLIRTFWAPNHPQALANPTEVYEITFPGYGVLTMQNRAFKLEFTKEYAAKKGYAPTMEGNWG